MESLMEPSAASKGSVDALPGLPDHEVLQELGRGGMGVVYLATNKVMGRNEVLKVVNPQMLTEPGAMDRFLQEIRSAAQLSHPNIVTAHAVLRSGESLVLAMEHIVGENLFKVVSERGPLPVANACYYIHQVAKGLQHANDKGMVHRDIKPDNLMLAREGKKHVVKILDFGLAKATREKENKQHNLTGDGKMMGTPDYIAPEQILDAAKADIRADVYSLGCTLYFLLTGSPPFQGGSLYEKLQAHMATVPTSVHELRNEVPPELAKIVAKMMAKDVKDRFQNPGDVAEALVPFVKGVKSLPTTEGKADPTGKTTALTGAASKSGGDGFTLVPSETRKTTTDAAPKKTMVESNAPGLTPSRPKVKSNPSAPLVANKKTFLLIGGGIAALCGFMLLSCLVGVGLWFGGVFGGKSQEPLAANQEAKQQPAGNPDAKQQPDGNPDAQLPPPGGQVAKLPAVKVDKTPPPIERDGFVPLFNGRDLSGWKNGPGPQGNWRVENGLLVGGGPNVSDLFTEKSDFKDFHLHVKARINHLGNSGVFFRAQFTPVGPKKKQSIAAFGYEAQINSTHADPRKTGSLYINAGGGGFQGYHSNLVPPPPNEWFDMDLIAEGPRIIIKVNGTVATDFLDNTRRFTSGHFGLQQLTPQTRAEFETIEIKELLPAPIKPLTSVTPPVEPAPKDEPFVPLFNGKDTTGWKLPPGQTDNWRVENGILMGPAKKAGYLYSERSDFRNFHLRAKARVSDGSNGGLYFRAPDIAEGKPQGYKVLLNSSDLDLSKAGSLLNGFSTVLQPCRESPVMPGKWFTIDVIAVRNQIVIKIDGKQTAAYEEKQLFAVGYLVLEQGDAQTALDFESIELRVMGVDAKVPGMAAATNPLPPPDPKSPPNPGPGANKILVNLKGALNAKDPPDFDNQGKIRGRLKIHPIQLTAGKTYVIALNSTAFDAYLRLQNQAGKTVAEDDDSGGNLNARITFRCTESGAYRIIASSFNGKLGPYQLIVQESP
jgi:serine/threonine protein kinase